MNMEFSIEILEDRKPVWKIGIEMILLCLVGIFINWLLDFQTKIIAPTLFLVGYCINLLLTLYGEVRAIKEAQADVVRGADAQEAKAKALLKQAIAKAKQANAIESENTRLKENVQKLSAERQVHQGKFRTLSKSLAIAEKEKAEALQSRSDAIERLEASHVSAYSTLEQENNRLKKQLQAIDRENREEVVRKAVRALKSSLRGDKDAIRVKCLERSKDEPLFIEWEKYY